MPIRIKIYIENTLKKINVPIQISKGNRIDNTETY